MSQFIDGEYILDHDSEQVFGIEADGIWKAAHRIRYTADGCMDLEDAYQEIILHIFEQVEKDSSILDQDPGYLLQRAIWYAGVELKRRNKQVSISVDSFEGDAWDYFDKLAYEDENEKRTQIRTAVDGMDQKNAKICQMLAQGYNKRESARACGISSPAVSKRIKKNIRPSLLNAIGPMGEKPKRVLKEKRELIDAPRTIFHEVIRQGYSYRDIDIQRGWSN